MVMTDHITGLIAAQAIGFALYRREKTGRGEAIDVPMLENMVSFVTSEHMAAATFDPPVGPTGDNRLLSPDYRPLPTKDGYITVGPNTNAQAFAFFDAIGRPELKSDPRFESASARTTNAAAYFDVRAAGLAQRTTAEWLETFEALEVPAARYNSIDDLFSDPHLLDIGFFEREQHPSEGRIRRTKVANTFYGGMREDQLPAPRLGEHTRAVLEGIGYSPAQIDGMIASGAARGEAGLRTCA
jgi:crotonobetainyl-CoA:carnitine CoA-transferase CaiB-like acyl-CoA transferase